MLPAVEEANAISEELDKKRRFEIMIVSPEARGELSGRTEVRIIEKEWMKLDISFWEKKNVKKNFCYVIGWKF